MSKIENFFNDSAYKEILESSETYNTRLCIERRLRMPFLDPQTGTAQNHSSLHKNSRQRMPGLREGQLYSYPAARWRKSRRQYLLQRSYRPVREPEHLMDADFSNHSMGNMDNLPTSLIGVGGDMEGGGGSGSGSGGGPSGGGLKDGGGGKDEMMNNKEWYYDEMDLNDMDGYDDADPDSDFDYEEPYSIRKKGGGGKKGGRNEGGSSRKSKVPASERTGSDTPAKKSSGNRRGRKSKLNLDGDRSSSPMAYSSKKSRHSMQIHDDHSNSSFVANLDSSPHMPSHPMNPQSQMITPRPELFGSSMVDRVDQQSPLTPISTSGAPPQSSAAAGGGPLLDAVGGPPAPAATAAGGEKDHSRRGEKGKLAAPSPYCDFCLGDTRENKKTGTAEELVSCSDCGRSGHPSCLQFTANMMISVKRYRWQCIECKYCSICGTSDNDDQLLFCDDCDRGYHMYCLSPALTSPPEGSWSCKLCLHEFHTPKPKQVPVSQQMASSSSGNPPPPPSSITQQLQQPGPPHQPPAGILGGPLPQQQQQVQQQMPYGPPPQGMMHHPGGGPPPPPMGPMVGHPGVPPGPMMHHPGGPPPGAYHGPPPGAAPPPTTHANSINNHPQ